jgi:hypothetical protein
MSMSTDVRGLTGVLRRAAVRATLAPSVHNTQPWRFELRPNELRLIADPTRQLHVLDPTGRQLVISCGCALFNARVAVAAAGFAVDVRRFPDSSRPDLLAVLTVVPDSDRAVEDIGRLDGGIDHRRTNRRRFTDEAVPDAVVDNLERAARAEDSMLFVVRHDQHRLAVASLSQRADGIQNADAAYRAELRAWTTTELSRRDGVPSAAVPHVNGHSRDDIPIRDFDSSGLGLLPSETHSSRNQCLLLLGTRGDNPAAWLRAGEALERILLELTGLGFTSSPLTQVVEVPSTRAELSERLQLPMSPHLLMRVGRAFDTPATRRRRLVDVLVESG